MSQNTTKELAKELDSNNKLSRFRNSFYIPDNKIYFDGNSLGLLSKDAEESLQRVLMEWKEQAIGGWLSAKQPWFYMAEEIGKRAATIVGAEKDELILTGTTTVNIHSLISSFYLPQGDKTKILADELNFPSDIYALQGQIQLRGLNPDKELLLVSSEDGYLLDERNQGLGFVF